ncbi:hypothetical protein ON010_g16906 [Phytophthora cinnamomi]|nr:hypothetical protein ON010_g16906 [Phytophthora cinnamomi]
MLGIDEAGRGPVMGPMVYGAAYWPVADNEAMSALGFDDSKALSAESRAQLFEKMRSTEGLGCVRCVAVQCNALGNCMVLNAKGYAVLLPAQVDRAADIRRRDLGQDAAPDQQPERDVAGRRHPADQRGAEEGGGREEGHFNGTIEFRVEKKADSLFKVVSAASIAAKVTRDRVISDWKWESPALDLPTDFGSGYPSDPKTKAWLTAHMDEVFVFPNIIRFSWGTVEPFFEKAVKVEWPHDKELEKVRGAR